MRSFDSHVTLVSAQSSDKGVEACFLKRLSRRLYMRRSRGWVNLWFTKLTYVRNFMFDNYVIDVFFLSLRLSANALALPDNAFVSRTFEKFFFQTYMYAVFKVQSWLTFHQSFKKKISFLLKSLVKPALSHQVSLFFFLIRRPPALPHRLQCSTIGRSGLNRRVRDGNGCFP